MHVMRILNNIWTPLKEVSSFLIVPLISWEMSLYMNKQQSWQHLFGVGIFRFFFWKLCFCCEQWFANYCL
jgi:hypothetical protein